MGCGCLLVLLGSAFPRVALFLTWILTSRVDLAFDGFLLPLAGFVFLPYTTLFYVFAYAPNVGVSTFGWILVAFGVLLDLGNWFGSGRAGSRRAWRARTGQLSGTSDGPLAGSSTLWWSGHRWPSHQRVEDGGQVSPPTGLRRPSS